MLLNYYSGILIMMDKFYDCKEEVYFCYNKDPELELLKQKYNLEEISSNSNEINKVIHTLYWFRNHIFHVQECNNISISNNAISLLDYSFNKGENYGLNCRLMSIALTECFLAIGLKARTIYLTPFSPYDIDSHVVCEVWINQLKKWVMIDPTYNGFITDKTGKILNIVELRHLLAHKSSIIFSDNFNYNGNYNLDFEYIKSYYAKNLFILSCYLIQGYNSEKNQENKLVMFVPDGYDIDKRKNINIKYRLNWGYNLPKKKSADKIDIIYKSANLLLKE